MTGEDGVYIQRIYRKYRMGTKLNTYGSHRPTLKEMNNSLKLELTVRWRRVHMHRGSDAEGR